MNLAMRTLKSAWLDERPVPQEVSAGPGLLMGEERLWTQRIWVLPAFGPRAAQHSSDVCTDLILTLN
jgi:hypothetical protein